MGTWNFTDTVNRIFTIDDIVVVSVADMVKKASDAATKLGGKIENLLIAGHGSDGPDLLRAVSQAEFAFREKKKTQRPLLPGMEGPILRCNPNACTIVSKGLWWGSPGGGGIN
jgi:hypothetical protein